MFDAIKSMFGGQGTDLSEVVKAGAVIIDVRTPGEYQGGHIRGSVNIPLDKLRNNLHKLKDKNKPVITCCASGMRSASAMSILKSEGYATVYNGGGWMSLKNKI